MMKRSASKVRTGDTITTAYSQRGWSIEVAWTIRERFVPSEGAAFDTVWFAGWDSFGTWRERCAGVRTDSAVYVLRDSDACPMPYGELETSAAAERALGDTGAETCLL